MTERTCTVSDPDHRVSAQQLHATAATHLRAACRAAGREVDLYSELELQTILFGELGLPPTPEARTDTASLHALHLRHPIPFLEHLLAYRRALGALGDLG